MKRMLPIAVVIAVAILVGLGAVVAVRRQVARQVVRPSATFVPPSAPRLPPRVEGLPTIACTSETSGERKEIFSTALFMPQWVGAVHDDTTWETEYLQDTARVLRSYFRSVGTASPPSPYLRFGHQPTDGYLDSGGNLRTGYHWKEALNGGQWSIDDYIAYTRQVGASPQVVVNFGTADALDAADLVAYSNGTNPNDPMVALRHQRGHKEPHSIEVWEIGNEQYGHWEAGFHFYPDGSVGSKDPDAYIRRVNEFATQMRARSPAPIKLYAPLTNWELNSYSDSALKSIVAQTAEYLDGYTVHYYPLPANGEAPEMWAGMSHLLGANLRTLKQMIGESSSKPMEIAITEWAGSAFPTHMGRNWLTGLLMADSYVALAEQGISIANYFASATPQGVPGGYSFWLDGDPARPAPTLIAARESARHLGRHLLGTSVVGAPTAKSQSYIGEAFDFPVLSALCSEDSVSRSLIVVNRSLNSQAANIEVGFPANGSTRITTLGAHPQAESVNVECSRYEAAQKFSLELAPFSVALLSFPSETGSGIGAVTCGDLS